MRKKLKGKIIKAISVLLCAVMMLGLMPDLSMTVYANEEGAYVQEEENIVMDTTDFSDAQVLTSVDGMLYIDGEKVEQSSSSRILPAGKYKLDGDIATSCNMVK